MITTLLCLAYIAVGYIGGLFMIFAHNIDDRNPWDLVSRSRLIAISWTIFLGPLSLVVGLILVIIYGIENWSHGLNHESFRLFGREYKE